MEKKQNFLLSKKIVTEEDYNTLVSNNENNNKNFTQNQITTKEDINDFEINNNNPMEINDSDNSEIIKKNENFLEPLNLDNIENEKKNYFDEKWKKNIENTYFDVKNNQNNLKEKFLENKFREKMEKKIEKEIYNNEYSEIYKKIKNEIFLNIKN